MGRKSCSQYSPCWAAPFTERCTGFSPCLRTHKQSLLSGFCHSALHLQCLGLSQAVTAQWERHIPPLRKGAPDLKIPTMTSLLSPSKRSSQKLSQTRCRETPLPSQLSCIAAAMSYSWPGLLTTKMAQRYRFQGTPPTAGERTRPALEKSRSCYLCAWHDCADKPRIW